MENKVVFEKLTAVFRNVFEDSSLMLNGDLKTKDLNNWDSLKQLVIITEIEKEFEIRFKIKEISSWSTINELIEILENKI